MSPVVDRLMCRALVLGVRLAGVVPVAWVVEVTFRPIGNGVYTYGGGTWA